MRKSLLFLICFYAKVVNAQPFESGMVATDFLTSYRIAWLQQELGIPIRPESNLMLYDTLENWLGTPYRYSGNCRKGIDCSGFVNVLYDRVFGIYLGARNSAEIYDRVQRVDRGELKEGDLVFFRIYKRRISHVGLYLGDNKFAHASTSRGVIISDLDEPYYHKYFAGAGRMENVIQPPVANENEN